ncbi:hypothetical protein jhhlp_001758 [Lomentospora prolificans]|uniref:Ketoreductase (KR) domain-containing protein n=1 Tax=Lomentospora prolificans TaxID=41688 RepID=A0A2N3NGQ7_9PEZI|nr:hypothetical protein jhhlp_001758 [Lomentospora prolificans]
MSATYAITGASGSLGWAFLKNISKDPNNVVIALVRNKVGTEKRVSEELSDRKNIHVVEADLTNYESIKKSADQVSTITGGSLDYLIANAGFVTRWSGNLPMTVIAETPQELEENLLDTYRINVIGQVHLFNLYIPLILKGNVKKVITLGTGLADPELTAKYKLELAGPYSLSKAATNLLVAKYHASYADQGVLFLSLSPGFVESGHQDNLTEQEIPYVQKMVASFIEYAPQFQKFSPEQSVEYMMKVVYNATVEKYGGAAVSHNGDGKWL